MLRKIVAAVLILVCVLAAASYLGPEWTIYRMRSAIEARDYKTFSSYVDFPALRDSFKRQLTATEGDRKERAQAGENPLTALGRGVVDAVAGPMLDALIQPAGVIEMMNAGSPKITQAVIASSLTRVPTAAAAIPEMQTEYQGWNRATFRGADAPVQDGSFVLLRNGWWSWRLAAVELPR